MIGESNQHQQFTRSHLKNRQMIGSHYDFMQWERNRNLAEYNHKQKTLSHCQNSRPIKMSFSPQNQLHSSRSQAKSLELTGFKWGLGLFLFLLLYGFWTIYPINYDFHFATFPKVELSSYLQNP